MSVPSGTHTHEMSTNQVRVGYNFCITASIWGKLGRRVSLGQQNEDLRVSRESGGGSLILIKISEQWCLRGTEDTRILQGRANIQKSVVEAHKHARWQTKKATFMIPSTSLERSGEQIAFVMCSPKAPALKTI